MQTASLVLLDLASTVLFLAVLLLGGTVGLAVVTGMIVGTAQMLWELAHRRPIETLQWMSFVLVLSSGTAALLTGDPRIVMMKPSVVYAVIAVVMLKRGWMTRYLPPVARERVPDVAIIFGYLWAALMFFSAILNIVVALRLSAIEWAAIMSVYAIASKVALFVVQFVTLRAIAVRRGPLPSG
jgi:intracellular septation protein